MDLLIAEIQQLLHKKVHKMGSFNTQFVLDAKHSGDIKIVSIFYS